jgi:hypothetical protein
VNEYLLGLAATEGWTVRAWGWPIYQIHTKYQVGVDRQTPWELDPVDRCEIQTPAAGAPPEAGEPGRFRRITVDTN